MTISIKIEIPDELADQLSSRLIEELIPYLPGSKPIDRELSTAEAMELTGYKSHEYYRAYLKRNKIKAVRQTKNVKYYLESDLTKAGNK